MDKERETKLAKISHHILLREFDGFMDRKVLDVMSRFSVIIEDMRSFRKKNKSDLTQLKEFVERKREDLIAIDTFLEDISNLCGDFIKLNTRGESDDENG